VALLGHGVSVMHKHCVLCRLSCDISCSNSQSVAVSEREVYLPALQEILQIRANQLIFREVQYAMRKYKHICGPVTYIHIHISF
jgi:hypothetical protein